MNLRRIIRFAGVGVVNTAVYYVLYLALRPSFGYLAAHVTAFILAMIGSYFLNCALTFRTRPTWRTFALFPLSNLTNFVLTTVGLRVAVGSMGMNAQIAPLVVAAAAIPFTYLAAHYIMLGRGHTKDQSPGAPLAPAVPADSGKSGN